MSAMRRLRRTLAHIAAPAAAIVPPPEEIERAYGPLELDEAQAEFFAESAALDESRAAQTASGAQKLYGFVDVVNPAPKALPQDEIEFYNQNGYTHPVRIYDEAETRANREYFDEMMGTLEAEGRSSYSINGFHMKCRVQWDMAMHPKILDLVEDVLGPNFVMWGSHFFCKQPHDAAPVPPHQDATYWPFATSRTCTVWLAIDDADEENAAMEFVSGSHRKAIPWLRTTMPKAVLGNELRAEELAPFGSTYLNAMEAGCISLHADLLVHGSQANLSPRRRCGFTLRYCASDCLPVGIANGEKGYGGQAMLCRGDPGVWGRPGMHIPAAPQGEDWSPLTPEQAEAARQAAR